MEKQITGIQSFVMKIYIPLFMIILSPGISFAQSLPGPGGQEELTFSQTKEKKKNTFWGNSTYVSTAVNFAGSPELDLSVGRTNGIAIHGQRGMGSIKLHSWGIGYSRIKQAGDVKQNLKAFYEYAFFPFIVLGNHVVRGEYFYNLTDKQHYLRPSVGLTFVHVDVAYNYSFLLNGGNDKNLYRHGISIRLKYFFHKRNWRRGTIK